MNKRQRLKQQKIATLNMYQGSKKDKRIQYENEKELNVSLTNTISSLTDIFNSLNVNSIISQHDENRNSLQSKFKDKFNVSIEHVLSYDDCRRLLNTVNDIAEANGIRSNTTKARQFRKNFMDAQTNSAIDESKIESIEETFHKHLENNLKLPYFSYENIHYNYSTFVLNAFEYVINNIVATVFEDSDKVRVRNAMDHYNIRTYTQAEMEGKNEHN